MSVLQASLPVIPWLDSRLSRLPGMLPLDPADWLLADDAFAGQMALRDRLIAERPDEVHALAGSAYAAAEELYETVLARLPALGQRVGTGEVVRPDGVVVPLDPARPLLTLGRLVQEDLCLMQEGAALGYPGEHVLTGAVLCFPASWTLAEKMLRPLIGIHRPVPVYDDGLAPRVQRLFDALAPDRPLWRMNAHRYLVPDLFHPRTEEDPRSRPKGPGGFMRCERQCLLRLPQTRAVVFSIHTYVVAIDNLPAEARAALGATAPVT